LLTFAALDTIHIVGHQFNEWIPGLWIAAPAAPQGAPLEEHCGPDARTIVQTESLNIEGQTGFWHHQDSRLLVLAGVGHTHTT
jgi:hypothetical protein